MERRGEETRIGDENREAEYWNRELAEIDQDEKIINLAIEREKRRLKDEQQRQAADALKAKEETLRQKAQGFQDEAPLPAQKQNEEYLKKLDQRRALEANIAQRRAELEATNREFYNITQAQEAYQKALEDLKSKETVLGRLSGQEQRAQDRVEALRLNLEDIEQRQGESTGAFDKLAEDQLNALDQQYQEHSAALDLPALSEDTDSFRDYTPDYDPSTSANDKDREDDQGRDRDQGPSLDP